MYRTWVLLRHTFNETIVQPIFPLLLALGAAILAIFAMLPYFTFGEDTIMFKRVTLDVVLLLVLFLTLFTASRSVFDEIEDRTMLTLMSKPVHKWEVLAGKYLGIVSAALLAVLILGVVLAICTWWRIPGDYSLNPASLDDRDRAALLDMRLMHLGGLAPSLTMVWLQVSVLAAVAVALSTRFSLVVNLPAVVLIYIAGNLTRFLFPMDAPGAVLEDRHPLVKGLVWLISQIIPFLRTFDITEYSVHATLAMPGTHFADDPHHISYLVLWGAVGAAALYALAYSCFALLAGMWLFQTRELGGSDQ